MRSSWKKIFSLMFFLIVFFSVFSFSFDLNSIINLGVEKTFANPAQPSLNTSSSTNPGSTYTYVPVPNTNCGADLGCHILKALFKATGFTASFLANFLAAVGSLFDFVLQKSVFEMRENLEPSKEVVQETWKIFRDICNIIIVFTLLYIGIKTIVEGKGFSDSKLLRNVILVSLFINFSLFFTTLAIDASNTVSAALYNSFNYQGQATSGELGLGQAMVGKLGIGDQIQKPSQTNSSPGDSYLSGFIKNVATIVFMLVGIVILLFATILVLTRYIILFILMITSPVPFAGMLLPQLKSQVGDTWLKSLKAQCMFLPIFLLMLLISFKMMDAIAKAPIVDGQNGWAITTGLLLTYGVAIGFLIASIIIAKKVSDSFGSAKISSVIGGATMGVSAWGAQKVFGRAGKKMSESAWAQRMASSNNFFARNLGRKAIYAGDGLSKSSFDIRNAKMFGLGKVVSGVAGEGDSKANWSQTLKNRETAQKQRLDLLTLKEDKKEEIREKEKVRMKDENGIEGDFTLAQIKQKETEAEAKIQENQTKITETNTKLTEIEQKLKDPKLDRVEKDKLEKEKEAQTKILEQHTQEKVGLEKTKTNIESMSKNFDEQITEKYGRAQKQKLQDMEKGWAGTKVFGVSRGDKRQARKFLKDGGKDKPISEIENLLKKLKELEEKVKKNDEEKNK